MTYCCIQNKCPEKLIPDIKNLTTPPITLYICKTITATPFQTIYYSINQLPM